MSARRVVATAAIIGDPRHGRQRINNTRTHPVLAGVAAAGRDGL
jgi:hypothetical protein